MVYPNYLNDRCESGFKCVKDKQDIILLENFVLSLTYNSKFQELVYYDYQEILSNKPRKFPNFYQYLVTRSVILSIFLKVMLGGPSQNFDGVDSSYNFLNNTCNNSSERVVQSKVNILTTTTTIRGGENELNLNTELQNEQKKARLKVTKKEYQRTKRQMSKVLIETSSDSQFQKIFKSSVRFIGKGAKLILKGDIINALKVLNAPRVKLKSLKTGQPNILGIHKSDKSVDMIKASSNITNGVPRNKTKSAVVQEQKLDVDLPIKDNQNNQRLQKADRKSLNPSSFKVIRTPSTMNKSTPTSSSIVVEAFPMPAGKLLGKPGSGLKPGLFKPVKSLNELSHQLDLVLSGRQSQLEASSSPIPDRPTQQPTFEAYTIDPNNHNRVRDKKAAYKIFQERMIKIGLESPNLSNIERRIFIERAQRCSFERFCALATEEGHMTIGTVREAETMIQPEFLKTFEEGSVRRTNKKEQNAGNTFDGRFDPPNKRLKMIREAEVMISVTDLDSKALVSQATIASDRERLAEYHAKKGDKGPKIQTAYNQGKNVGKRALKQMLNKINAKSSDLPNGLPNIVEVVNMIELPQAETKEAIRGLHDGLSEALH